MSAPDTLTLASLRTMDFAPGQLGVLGDPIAHSLSPAMHNAALATLLPTHPRLAGVRYHRLHVTAGELPEALTLLHAKGFAGVNLTVPHKIQALTLVETLSAEAKRAAGDVQRRGRRVGGDAMRRAGRLAERLVIAQFAERTKDRRFVERVVRRDLRQRRLTGCGGRG